MNRTKLEAALAKQIPAMAQDALSAAEALFVQRASVGATSGPKGPNALHMRIGTIDQAVDGNTQSPFVQWAERALDGENGARFAPITAAKAWTSAQFFADSDIAARTRPSIPEGARRYTGGVHYCAFFEHDGQEYTIAIVAACSGVPGTDDRAIAYALAMVFASEWTKALRKLLGV